jgi:hypothetical protein
VSTDDVILTNYATPTVSNAGVDQNNCNNTSFTLAGNNPSAGSGAWTVTSGTATVTTPTQFNSTVTGVPVGTSATLTWTISNGTCTASSDQVVLTNSTVPSTANAGVDQNICGTSVIMAGNTPASGTGTWTRISGPNVPNIVSPNSATTSIGSLITGTYIFQWSINNPGCVASTDQVSVTVTTSALTANAGVDQSQCGNGNFTLNGSISGGGSTAWTVVSGSANISVPSSLTSAVTSIAAGTSATLQLTTTSGACSASDQVILTNNAVPVMTSATSKTICSDVAVNLNLTSSVSANYSWVAASNGNITGESTTNQSSATITDVLTNTSTSTSANQTVTYTVTPTAIAGACPGTPQTVSVVVTAPVLASITGVRTSCGATVNEVLSANSTALISSHQWYFNNSPISGATASTYTATVSGNYYVIVSNSNGCQFTSATYALSLSSAFSASVSSTNETCNSAANGTASVTASNGVNEKVIDFNTSGNWTQVPSGTLYSTYSGHSYSESNWSFAATRAIRDDFYPLNSNPSTLGGFAYRLDATSNDWIATYNGTNQVTGFSFNIRRFSLNPLNWTVSYSTDGGTTWTAALNTFTTTNLPNTNWSKYSYTFPSAVQVSSGQLKIKVTWVSGASGQVLVDDFGFSANPTYLWSNGAATASINSLSAGTYTVTVTNNNSCVVTQTVTITAPSAISVTSTPTDVSCFGGTNGAINTTISGGTGGYTYLWNTTPARTTASIAGLAAGSYTITVTDNTGCSKVQTFVITQPSAISGSASAGTTSLLCNGNTTTLSVSASGGVTPYTYSLNGGAYQGASTFTVGAGTYTVTVRDANLCTFNTNTVVITQPAVLTASISAGSIACFGGTTTLTTTAGGGTTPYQYSLNGGSYQGPNTFTISAGTYTVTVKDANLCTVSSNTITVTQPSAVGSPTAGSNSPICSGTTLNLTSTTVIGATYSWTGPNGYTSSLQNPTRTNAQVSITGLYSVVAIIGGCPSSASSVSVTVNQTPSITTQPVNAQVAQAAVTTVSVVASGSGLTYQ